MTVSNKQSKRIYELFSGNCMQKNICPVKDILASFGDKWSMLVVLMLGQNKCMRFTELRFCIKNISQRMLTVTLRSLEKDGIVIRTEYSETPPKVEYALTELGEGFLNQLIGLANWADQHFSEIIKARKKYGKKLTD